MTKWTEEEKAIVRCEFQGGHADAERLAVKLKRTGRSVRYMAGTMGIVKYCRWTAADERKLEYLISRYPISVVSRMMKRSRDTIQAKCHRMKISSRNRDGWFTESEICVITGVPLSRAKVWIDKKQLKASYHHEVRPGQNGGACWHIEEKDLKQFIRTYPGELQGRNVDMYMLVDILAGIMREVE